MKTLFCIPLILSCLAFSFLSSAQPGKSNASEAQSLFQKYLAKNKITLSTASVVQKMDSSHLTLSNSSGQMSLAERRLFSHYPDGKISKMVLWWPDQSTGWNDQIIDSSFYNGQGYMHQTKTYEKTPGSNWMPQSITNRTFNSYGYDTESIFRIWSQGFWVNYYKYSISYLQDSLLKESVLQLWDGNTYQNSSKSIIVYGSNNFPIQAWGLTWAISDWDTIVKSEISFLANQEYIELNFSKNGGIWDTTQRTTIFYGPGGLPDSVVFERKESGIWQKTDQIFFSFDAHQNNIQTQFWSRNPVNSEWYLNSQNDNFFSENVVTGLQSNRMENKAKLFPNPANELLNAEFETEGAIKIKILDVQGKVWLEDNRRPDFLQKSVQLNVKHLSPGVYWLQYQTPEGYIRTSSFLIRK